MLQQPAIISRWTLAIACLLLTLFTPAFAQLAVPALVGHVIDTTRTLSAEQTAGLEQKLSAFEQKSGAQVVVLMIATTLPEDISSYANRVANQWKIGRKEIGDGLLVVVAKDDRKVRIEVAKSLEGAIPDLAAKRIIDQAMTPYFKQSAFAEGLDAAVDLLAARITGEALPAPASSGKAREKPFQWDDLAIFLFFAVPVVGSLARKLFGSKLGSLVTGGAVGVIALVFTSSLLLAFLAAVAGLFLSLFSVVSPSLLGLGAGRGNWRSGSGGGFRSGGGGDFGGGGASGGW